jgi:16S rRNA (cytidine1402-2'-O)-methyltransferase
VTGKIYLIPVTLGGDDYSMVIPEKVINLTRTLRIFIVENTRSARRYLRLIDKKFPVDDTTFLEINKHTPESGLDHYLDSVTEGKDIGIMSEAGLPGIADPGSAIIALAHRRGIRIIPLSGPSSIILALISSGLNGQSFTFNGYLPVRPADLSAKLLKLEKRAGEGYSQIFMETPYRNQKMLDSILSTCNNNTMLCIATDITLPSEMIRSKRVYEWKKDLPVLNKKPTIFILQQE